MRRNMLHWDYDTIFIPFRLYYNLNTENVLIQMRYFYTKKNQSYSNNNNKAQRSFINLTERFHFNLSYFVQSC